MRRRAFFSLLGGATAWPILGRATHIDRTRRIGLLLLFSAKDHEVEARVRPFVQTLHDLGWDEGRNIQIEYRFGGGDIERLRVFARELVEQRVDVIVTNIGFSIPTALQQTSIPIVFAMVHSLSESGWISNVSHPGGNVTGFATFEPSIGGKWLQFLKAIAPDVIRAGFMFNPTASGLWKTWLHELQAVAPDVAIEPLELPVHDLVEIEGRLESMGHDASSGLIILPDTFTLANYSHIVAGVLEHKVPACYPYRYFVSQGGLMSYGPNLPQGYRQVASYVDRILRGTNPGDLPIQQSNAFELVINLKAAKALGLAVPPWMVARAGEVIE
jgi:putative tryptophan/tyrosine transport system substrate-binding protein